MKKDSADVTPADEKNDLVAFTEGLLVEARSSIENKKTLSVPIAELATLGAAVSSLNPALSTITTTTTLPTNGLYRVANQVVGDVLKMAKDGTAWGAMKTAEGSSKMAKLAAAGPLSATTTTQMLVPPEPATMMIAVALYSIEKQLGEIADTTKEILSFLETKDEAKVEGDLETLTELIKNYKYNWDNEVYVKSSHKLVMDIKRTSRSNMLSYQKKVDSLVSSKILFSAQGQVKSTLNDLEKRFKYYRLSLYTYSLGSMMEVMLGGNFREEYIAGVKDEICKLSTTYREEFDKASIWKNCRVPLLRVMF